MLSVSPLHRLTHHCLISATQEGKGFLELLNGKIAAEQAKTKPDNSEEPVISDKTESWSGRVDRGGGASCLTRTGYFEFSP